MLFGVGESTEISVNSNQPPSQNGILSYHLEVTGWAVFYYSIEGQ